MRRQSVLSRLTAAVTIVALQAFLVVPAQPADASLHGRVLSGDDLPLAGARVHVGNVPGERFYASGWTTDDGTFEVPDLPAAEYRLAVEVDGGLYMVSSPVVIAPGQSRSLQLAINPDNGDDATPEDEKKKKKRGGAWNNPLTATLIVLGTAIAIGLLLDAADSDSGQVQSVTNPTF